MDSFPGIFSNSLNYLSWNVSSLLLAELTLFWLDISIIWSCKSFYNLFNSISLWSYIWFLNSMSFCNLTNFSANFYLSMISFMFFVFSTCLILTTSACATCCDCLSFLNLSMKFWLIFICFICWPPNATCPFGSFWIYDAELTVVLVFLVLFRTVVLFELSYSLELFGPS